MTRFSGIIRDISQSLNVSDLIIKITTRVRFATEGLNIGSFVSRMSNIFRNINQNIDLSSLLTRYVLIVRDARQNISFNLLATRNLIFTRFSNMSISFSTIATRIASFIRTPMQSIRLFLLNFEMWTCQVGISCPEEAVPGITIISGAGGSSWGVPYQFEITNLTIESIQGKEMNMWFIITNKGYNNPIDVNLTQRILLESTIVVPIEMEIYSNSTIISLDYMQMVNSSFYWSDILPYGIYRLEVFGESVDNPKVIARDILKFNYTDEKIIVGDEIIYSYSPEPSLADMMNNPYVKTICYVAGAGVMGAIGFVLVREWVFRKRRQTRETIPPQYVK